MIGPVIAWVIARVSARFKAMSHRLQAAMGEVTRHSAQAIAGHREVLAFGTQQEESQRFERINNHNRRQSMKLATTSAISNPVIQLIASLAIAGVLWLASLDGVIEQLSAGAFTATLVAMGSLLRPLKQLSNVNQQIQRALAAAESLFALLAEAPEPDSGQQRLGCFERAIEVRSLNFNYPDCDKPALTDISFTLARGQSLALVGASGSGKSSLINLLLRFYADESAAIRIDGVPLSALSLKELRQQFSLVSQQVVLVDDSIAANIAYGCGPDISRAAIEQAARDALVWDFARELPDGLDSAIGENGNRLSGGQRQRIAIARALLRDAPILILDEATSALDSRSERQIQQSLARLQATKTTLVIAHRLSTVQTADQILVMDQGQICESGNHQELLAQQGAYHRLYHQQFQQAG